MPSENRWDRGPDESKWRESMIRFRQQFYWEFVGSQIVTQGSTSGGIAFFPGTDGGPGFFVGSTGNVNQIELHFQRSKNFKNSGQICKAERQLDEIERKLELCERETDESSGGCWMIALAVMTFPIGLMFFWLEGQATKSGGILAIVGVCIIGFSLMCYFAGSGSSKKGRTLEEQREDLQIKQQEVFNNVEPFLKKL